MSIRVFIFLFAVTVPLMGYAQGESLELYQYNYTSISPAFAGTDGTKITQMDNMVLVKGAPYSAFLAGEAKVGNIGFGLTGLRTRLGPQTTNEISVPVNYQWKIADKSSVVFGARLSYQQVVIDWTQYNPIDPGDPLLNAPDKTSRSMPNLGLGGLYKVDKFYAGFSVANLFYQEDQHSDKIPAPPTRYDLIVGRDFHGSGKFAFTHSIYGSMMKDSWRVDLNSSVRYNDRWILGGSLELNDDYDGLLAKLNAGVKFGKIGQAIVMLYSKKSEVNHYGTPRGQLILVFTLPSL